MFLAYDGIVFDMLYLHGWDQNAIWSDDGVDFLYWHHLIDVTCIVNPNVVAAVFMPKLKREGINARLKKEIQAVDARLRGEDAKARAEGRLPPHGRVPGRPIKTPIKPPVDWRPRTDIDIKARASYFIDSNGDNSQRAIPGVPNYPPATEVAPGIPYAQDLAYKTGPLQEPGCTTQTEYSTGGGTVSPGTLNETDAGVYGANPEKQLVFQAFTPQDLVGPILGAPRPPVNPTAEPPLNPRQRGPLPPGPGNRVRFPANANLPASDLELRDRLQVPRRQLKVWVNSGPGGAPEFLLNLPYEGCQTDAKDGPRCVDQHMAAIHGNVTGVKRLVFECFEALPLYFGKGEGGARLKGDNKPLQPGVRPGGAGNLGGNRAPLNPPIISNRWTMRQVPDQATFLNSTVIEGKAVFRLDVLSRLGMTVDQLRKYIMPPLATGYVRRPVQMQIGSAGNELLYSVVDDQQMMNNPAGQRWGVHSVQVLDSCFVNNPLDAVAKYYREDRGRGRGRR